MTLNGILHKLGLHRADKEDEKTAKLKSEYNELLNRLSDIRNNFDYTDNPSSIDALIYEENATLCRLRELYSEARERSVTIDAFDSSKK